MYGTVKKKLPYNQYTVLCTVIVLMPIRIWLPILMPIKFRILLPSFTQVGKSEIFFDFHSQQWLFTFYIQKFVFTTASPLIMIRKYPYSTASLIRMIRNQEAKKIRKMEGIRAINEFNLYGTYTNCFLQSSPTLCHYKNFLIRIRNLNFRKFLIRESIHSLGQESGQDMDPKHWIPVQVRNRTLSLMRRNWSATTRTCEMNSVSSLVARPRTSSAYRYSSTASIWSAFTGSFSRLSWKPKGFNLFFFIRGLSCPSSVQISVKLS